MSEADEVAESLAPQAPPLESLDDARRYVRRWMPDYSEQVVDNVAWSLYHNQTGSQA